MAACRWQCETPLDIFGATRDRRLERALRDAFLETVAGTAKRLSGENLEDSVALAEAPLKVRGFGLVKMPDAEAPMKRLCRRPSRE
jgi:indolepyruvate ferredoxin oxidoreductase